MEGCAGRSTGTSPGPQIADDFFALRKSAEVGQYLTLGLSHCGRSCEHQYVGSQERLGLRHLDDYFD
jgi:hypothetical protein